jgi:chromosome partitioning protein
MAIVAVFNSQDGVGKTTTALNLLAAIARRGERPLAIDLDPQARLSALFGAQSTSYQDSIAAFLARDAALDDIAQITRSGVVLCAAHAALGGLDQKLGKGLLVINQLRHALRRTKAFRGPVVIDCGRTWSGPTLNALLACDLVLVPMGEQPSPNTEGKVARGLDALSRVLRYHLPRRYLCTRVADDGRIDRHAIGAEANDIAPDEICATRIRADAALVESGDAGLDIFRHAPESSGAQDYAALVDELRGWLR